MHWVLPVATGVKQPTHVYTQNINSNTKECGFCVLIGKQTHINMHTQYTWLWNSPGFNRSQRWRAEWTEHVAVASVMFMLGGWEGEHSVMWTCQKLLACYGSLREPTVPTAHWSLCKAKRVKFVTVLPDQLQIWYEWEDKNCTKLLAERLFIKSSSLFKLAFLFKYFFYFWFNRFGLSLSAFTETSDFISQRNLFKYFYIKFVKQGEAVPFFLNISISQFIRITWRGYRIFC